MPDKDNTIKKLIGIKEDEERVFYVQFQDLNGEAHSETKIYFKKQEDAISYFKIVSQTNPLVIVNDEIYTWYYKQIEKELGAEREALKFYYISNTQILLGSEILKVYPNRKSAIEARTLKEGELRRRCDEVDRKKVE